MNMWTSRASSANLIFALQLTMLVCGMHHKGTNDGNVSHSKGQHHGLQKESTRRQNVSSLELNSATNGFLSVVDFGNVSKNDERLTSLELNRSRKPDHTEPHSSRFADREKSFLQSNSNINSESFLSSSGYVPAFNSTNSWSPFIVHTNVNSPSNQAKDGTTSELPTVNVSHTVGSNHSLTREFASINYKAEMSNGSEADDGLEDVFIGALFEHDQKGRCELAAAELAAQDVNSKRYIPGYYLRLLKNDTKCDPGYGADAFYDFMYRKPGIIMLIGTSCSEVTKTLGEIVPYWNLILVSHAATSPALTDREKYTTFYRLAPADSSHNAARRAFIQHFNWNRVATIQQDQDTFTLAMDDMNKEFDRVNITIYSALTFRNTQSDLRLKLNNLKKSDARVIIGSFDEKSARRVFCEAFQLGMYGPRFVWMLRGDYTRNWWLLEQEDVNCTSEQLAEAVDGYFSVDSFNSIIGNQSSIANISSSEFLSQYRRKYGSHVSSIYAPMTYDSIWAVATTLRQAIIKWKEEGQTLNKSISKFNYKTGSLINDDFVKIMGNLDFMGVSGPVTFDGPDRRGVSLLEQNQGGNMVRIALFNPEDTTCSLDWYCEGCKPVHWMDAFTIVVQPENVDAETFIVICGVALVGIFLATFLLAFNIYYRKLRYIKLSSPKLNNVAVVGCVLVYVAVILLGLDDALIPDKYFSIICTVRAFLLAAGFSLSFGAMFTKTFRVHQIFRGCQSGLVKNKLLKDKQLLLIIGGLLLMDSLFMSLWVSIDPMKLQFTNLTKQLSSENRDLVIVPQLSRCYSQHFNKWTGALYACKGLLLVFGVYMAWETRHVKIPVLNDSQYIGMNIYNVVLSSVTLVVLSTILTDKPTLSYLVIATLILLSTTGLLGLLFLPKIYSIVKHSRSPVITTTGITVEAKTRRFVVDEQRELRYRAEVQNRVYKRELIELEQECIRLQRLCDAPLEAYDEFTEQCFERHNKLTRGTSILRRCGSITDVSDLHFGESMATESVYINSMSYSDNEIKRHVGQLDLGNSILASERACSGMEQDGMPMTNLNRNVKVKENRCRDGNENKGLDCGDIAGGSSRANHAMTRCDSNVTVANRQGRRQMSPLCSNSCLSSDYRTMPFHNTNRSLSDMKMRILVREVTKIHTELSSLGDLEIDVSYV